MKTVKTLNRENRQRRRRRPGVDRETPQNQQGSAPSGRSASPAFRKDSLPNVVVGGVILGAIFSWAYWPTLVKLVHAWDTQPDYSHGFLVAPVAIYILWARKDRFPGFTGGLAWPGLILIGLGIGVRALGAVFYLDSADGWSIPFWVAGVIWLFCGRRVVWWSLPSVVFLWFMVPVPYRVERWLSLPLQGVAARLSCWTLQGFGQPALREGNTIVLGEYQLGIEEACSGLRIFVGILALAFAYLILARRAWWEKVLLIISVVPIALIANSTRIVGTGLLYQFVSGEAGEKFMHDVAGWVMIPFAAGLFALVLWYLGKLMPEVELVDVGAVVRRERG